MNPLEQGLKHSSLISDIPLIFVKVVYPLKQGLKHSCSYNNVKVYIIVLK